MSDHERTYGEALAEVQRLLATPRTPASADGRDQTTCPPGDQLSERLFPSIGVARLREQFGTPDELLRLAGLVVSDGRTRAGLLPDADCAQVLDLLGLARWWIRVECWRPIPMELRNAGSHIVTGKRTTFHRETTRRQPWYSRLLRGDSA